MWNEDKCRCECKEDLIDKEICDKGFIWNPSSCECECDRSCDKIGEYLYFKSCVCKSTLIDKLVEECTSVSDRDKIYNDTLNIIPSDECSSCTVYIVLFAVFFTMSIIIDSSLSIFIGIQKR